jgi:transcriptional regulator with XRE-family HTH domain
VTVAEQFAANLVRCRKRAGISQEQLGFLADLHRTEIGMLERGARLARIDTVVKLAGGLEIDPGELLDGITWKPGGTIVGRFEVPERGLIRRPDTSSAQKASDQLPRMAEPAEAGS